MLDLCRRFLIDLDELQREAKQLACIELSKFTFIVGASGESGSTSSIALP